MKILRFFKNFLSTYIGTVLLLIAIFTTFIGYQFRRNYACDCLILFVVCAAIVAFIYFLIQFAKQKKPNLYKHIKSEKFFYQTLIIGSVITLILQLIIVNGAWFIAGWDTRDVIFPDKQMNSDYMSMYPNQLFLAGLFRRINWICTNIFNLDFNGYYFVLVVLSMLCVFCSVILIGFIAKKLCSPIVATITFVCAVLFIGLSPWMMIPYSDTFAMFFTTLSLFLFLYIDIVPVRWFVVIFCSIIGYSIKPTAIFVLLAILFVELCNVIGNYKSYIKKVSKLNAIKVCVCVMLCLFSFGFANVLCHKVADYGVQIDSDRNFTATHFLMMGINLENHGGWNNDDVNISRSYANVDDRQAGNLKQWQHRLTTYGPFEIGFIFLNKTLTNFNDGSFAWEAELPWMMENKGQNPVVWWFYGIDPADNHNDNNNISAYCRQIMWYLVLFGCVGLFAYKKPKKGDFVVYLCILSISAFLTVCEPDPRYMILYLPFFVLASMQGWNSIYKVCNKTKVLRKANEKIIR